MTTLDVQRSGKAFDANHAVLRQVGWLGHRRGDVYSLDGSPNCLQEPGGYSPLYIQVGTYVFDADGTKTWED